MIPSINITCRKLSYSFDKVLDVDSVPKLTAGWSFIFDKRVLSKNVWQAVFGLFASCTKRVGSLAEMPRATVQWLNL
jgi:hypothetical protein